MMNAETELFSTCALCLRRLCRRQPMECGGLPPLWLCQETVSLRKRAAGMSGLFGSGQSGGNPPHSMFAQRDAGMLVSPPQLGTLRPTGIKAAALGRNAPRHGRLSSGSHGTPATFSRPRERAFVPPAPSFARSWSRRSARGQTRPVTCRSWPARRLLPSRQSEGVGREPHGSQGQFTLRNLHGLGQARPQSFGQWFAIRLRNHGSSSP